MMTIGEAMQRCTVNDVSIKRVDKASVTWIVTLKEWTANQCHKFRYITDDLEDAVLAGGNMRHDANKKPHLFS